MSSQYCYLSISWMVTERVNFFLIFYPRISCNMNVFTVRFYHFLLYTLVSPKLRKAFKTKRCVGICQERWEKVSFIKLGLIYFSFMHFVRSCRSVTPGLMDDMPSIRIVSGWELQTYSLFFDKSWRRQYKIAFAINSSSIGLHHYSTCLHL